MILRYSLLICPRLGSTHDLVCEKILPKSTQKSITAYSYKHVKKLLYWFFSALNEVVNIMVNVTNGEGVKNLRFEKLEISAKEGLLSIVADF